MNEVLSNSIEDFRDEYTESVLGRYVESAFAPLKSKLTDSEFDEALGGAIATLQSGVYSASLNYVNDVILPNLSLRAVALYTYIMTGKVAKGLSSFTKKRFSNIRSGRIMGKVLNFLTEGQKERGDRATLANDLVSHLENQKSQREKITNDTFNSLNSSQSDSNHALSLYTQKTRVGSWTNSPQDKKLYERATKTKIKKGVSWDKLSKKLNTYQSFAKDTEDNIINQAQVYFDTFVSEGKVSY